MRIHRYTSVLVIVPLCAGSLLTGARAGAVPIELAGFTFEMGEQAFADDAFLVSGTIRWWCASPGVEPAASVAEALTGSDTDHCVNNDTGNSGIVEVLFLDNAIVNDAGIDLVIFEGSGTLPAGTPDPRERFGVAVYDGSQFTSFQYFDPISFGSGGLFTVGIDLGAFGIAAGEPVNRVQLHVFDVGLGTKSADISALGALNSIPEPSTAVLVCLGLATLAGARRARLAGR